MSTITTERLTKILSETQAVITECNSRGVHGSVEVNARLFENVLMELLRHRAATLQGAEQPQSAQQNIPENIPTLREAVIAMRNSGIDIDIEKIMAERDFQNSTVIPGGWTPVSERMPEEGGKVLVIDDAGNMFICWHKLGFWADYRIGENLHKLTHWMPLPAAPQQEVK